MAIDSTKHLRISAVELHRISSAGLSFCPPAPAPKFGGFPKSLKMTFPALLELFFALLPRKERL
jgi:hypothetical protein